MYMDLLFSTCAVKMYTILFKIHEYSMGYIIYVCIIHESFHFGNESNIHMSPEHYEANGYRHKLDLLISSH